MAEWISEAEAARRIRDEANRIADERIAKMADKDGERLAVLETRYHHMEQQLNLLVQQVGEMHELMLKAKGARWAILGIAGIAGFISAKLTTVAALFGLRMP